MNRRGRRSGGLLEFLNVEYLDPSGAALFSGAMLTSVGRQVDELAAESSTAS